MARLTLVIGNKNYSSWSLRPWLFLKKFRIDFTEERVPLDTPATKALLRPYGSGDKVPVLVDAVMPDEKRTIWDSLAILEYLSETFTQGRGWPKNDSMRAMARSISAEMHASFPNLRAELPMNCRKTFSTITPSPAATEEISRIMQLWSTCRALHRDKGNWLFGEFSIADAMYAPVVLRFVGYQVPVDAVIEAYIKTVFEDEAVQSWITDAKAETEVIEQDER